MSSFGLVLDRVFEAHDTGPGHVEGAQRVVRAYEALEDAGLAGRARRIEPRPATDDMLAAVHDPAYVASIAAACARGVTALDNDTSICEASDRVARLAAGSLVALCEEVAAGRLGRGFAAVRPPGHHAERSRAMGFCLFNNVAVAAQWLTANGFPRVMIVDWDVHHGNGTQHIFEERGDVLYCSIHQSPLYPGTGARDETGVGAGAGATLNCPLPPGAGDAEFLSALREEIVPAGERFDPDFVLISAGFDAHHLDPLANLEVTTEAYDEATALLAGLAARHCAGRLVSVLEGGYDLEALGQSIVTHVRRLMRSDD